MRPSLLGAGLLLGGLVGLALWALPTDEPSLPAVDTQRLAKVARKYLGEVHDSAAVMDLLDGRLLLTHHERTLRHHRILPGSVMKAFTAYALIEAGRTDNSFVCGGEHRDQHGIARPCWRRDGHGPMRLRTALAESCNVWFYEQSQYLGDRRLVEIYREFGLGAPWASTQDPEDSVKRDLVSRAIPARDLPDVAVGDHLAFRVTPMSLLRAVSIIATGSQRWDPGRQGRSCEAPYCVRPQLNPAALELIAEGMQAATTSGTLGGVFPPEAQVAAKTGTAKKWETPGMRGLVLGFLPMHAPRFAFVVVKDGQGARDAGPVAAEIVAILAENLAVAP